MRRVTDMFHVRLRVTTGAKKVFIISSREMREADVSESEMTYFRPVADEIRNGRVISNALVFYPYDNGRLSLSSVDELRRSVPWFYEAKLYPNMTKLSSGKSIRKRQWWELVEPRPTWMSTTRPRILCPAFGQCGSFAIDFTGRYAILQGNALFWRSGDDNEELLLAYLALFNSYEFESLLELLCRRVGGGQYELYRADLSRVPLPDLSLVDTEIRRVLTQQGYRISQGDGFDPRDVSEAVSFAYGSELRAFRTKFPRGRLGDLQDRFDHLKRKWIKECGHSSKLSTIVAKPGYQQIIDLGTDVVSIILRELQRRPNHWFVALETITGENPVERSSRGRMAAMTQAWLSWGKQSNRF